MKLDWASFLFGVYIGVVLMAIWALIGTQFLPN